MSHSQSRMMGAFIIIITNSKPNIPKVQEKARYLVGSDQELQMPGEGGVPPTMYWMLGGLTAQNHPSADGCIVLSSTHHLSGPPISSGW